MNLVTLKKVAIMSFSLLVLVSLFNGCGEDGSRPVARVGGRAITESDFINSYTQGKNTDALVTAALEDKQKHLETMIDRELLLVAAYNKNLDKDSTIVEQVQDRVEAEVFRYLYDVQVIDHVISEKTIKDIYEKSKKEVKIQDVFLKLSSNPSEEEQQEFDTKLNLVQEDIKNGIEFADIVRKYSDDTKRKGMLKWSASTLENQLHQKAFTMKEGEISEPIKTNLGYSIIKVVEIHNIDARPYETEKDRIKRELLRMRSKDLQKRAQEYINSLEEKYNGKLETENIERFISIYKGEDSDSTSEDSTITAKPPKQPSLDNFSDEDKEINLVSHDGGGVTISYFIDQIKNVPPMRLPRIDEVGSLTMFLKQSFLPQSLLRKYMNDNNLMKNKEVEEKLQEHRENLMVNLIRKQEIDDKIELHEDSLKQYYETNKDEFKVPAKREIREISINDEELAKKVAKRAKAGENFLKLTRKYNEKTITKKKDGYLGFVSKAPQYVGKAAFEVNVGEVAGPVKIGNNYSIIKVLSEQEESYQAFEESKNKVKAKVQSEMRKKREEEWKKELRDNIKVTVFEKRLDEIFKDLQTDE